MNNRWSVLGFTLLSLAVLVILLLSDSPSGGMMWPGWGYGMMGPWDGMMGGGWGFAPFGWIVMVLAWLILIFFVTALAFWVAQNWRKKK